MRPCCRTRTRAETPPPRGPGRAARRSAWAVGNRGPAADSDRAARTAWYPSPGLRLAPPLTLTLPLRRLSNRRLARRTLDRRDRRLLLLRLGRVLRRLDRGQIDLRRVHRAGLTAAGFRLEFVVEGLLFGR